MKPSDKHKPLSAATLDDRINPLQGTSGGTGSAVEPEHINREIDTEAANGTVSDGRTPENEPETASPTSEKKSDPTTSSKTKK